MSLKSKGSKQKLRRWSFIAHLKLEAAGERAFKMPGFVFGNSAEARNTADELKKKFLDGEDKFDAVEIECVAHETVSIDTQRQLLGLNDQVNLMTKTSFVLAERLRLGLGESKDVAELVGDAVEQARKHLFPRLEKAKEKMAALEASVNASPDAAVTEGITGEGGELAA
jgi:hypothetical protein